MQPLSQTAKGLAASVSASFFFGFLYFYATLLAPLSGTDIFGWRTVLTFPFLTLFMVQAGYWHFVTAIIGRVRRKPFFALMLVISAFLLGIQFWLFLWAPVNGRALQVSLGYLLMPFTMVLCGTLIYRDELLPFQKIAVVFAALGVGNQVWRLGGVPWEALLVALGFPVYFILRRKLKTDNLGGLWVDMLFMLPPAGWILCTSDTGFGFFAEMPVMLVTVPLLGIMSAVANALYFVASGLLPLSLFGLLSYVEPVILVCVSLLLGERVTPGEELTYAGVGLAVTTLFLGGVFRLKRGKYHKRAPLP